MKFHLSSLLPPALFAALVAVAGPAAAQAPARVGMLRCMVAPGAGMVVTSNRALDCAFIPDVGGPPERYVGTVTRLGLDLGPTGPGELDWGVLAPTAHFGPGALAGVYSGVGASASVGIGAGAALLVGGNARTTSLQPLSVQGQTGANVAAGIEQIRLDYAMPPAGRRVSVRRHYRSAHAHRMRHYRHRHYS